MAVIMAKVSSFSEFQNGWIVPLFDFTSMMTWNISPGSPVNFIYM